MDKKRLRKLLVEEGKNDSKLNLNILQSNYLTNAKYNYSAMQKNILHLIIWKMQRKLQTTLFGDVNVLLPLSMLGKNNNYPYVVREAKKLMKMSVTHFFKKDKDEYEATMVPFSSVIKKARSPYLAISVNNLFFKFIGDQKKGFTKYGIECTLILKSKYSKRMYEFCSKFKNLGGYSISVRDFKEMICVPDRYNLGKMRQTVLEVARKELKESVGVSDLFFEYSVSEEKKILNFKIINRKETPKSLLEKNKQMEEYEKNSKEKMYIYLRKELCGKYRFRHNILSHLSVGDVYKLYLRIIKLKDEEKNNKKLIEYILKQDFNLNPYPEKWII